MPVRALRETLPILLLLVVHTVRAQMSNPVDCVGQGSIVEHEVREVCCETGSACQFWGRGEPVQCTQECHNYFVPLYTNCSYLWSQQNQTLDSAGNLATNIDVSPTRLDLSELFRLCTVDPTWGSGGAIDTAIENECAKTDFTAVASIGGSANVHDYNTNWELCYLNVPRLSALCGSDTAACMDVVGANRVDHAGVQADLCDDPYSPYYVECLIFTG